MHVQVAEELKTHSDIERIVHETEQVAGTSLGALGAEDPGLHISLQPRKSDTSAFGRYVRPRGLIKVYVAPSAYNEQRAIVMNTSAHEILHRARHLQGLVPTVGFFPKLRDNAIEEGFADIFAETIIDQLGGEKTFPIPKMPGKEAAQRVLSSTGRELLRLQRRPEYQGALITHIVGYNALKLLVDPTVVDANFYLATRQDIRTRLVEVLDDGNA